MAVSGLPFDGAFFCGAREPTRVGRPPALACTRLGAGGEAYAGAFERGGQPLIEAVDIGKVLHLAGIIDDRREVGDVHGDWLASARSHRRV